MWNDRYASDAYLFGTEPAAFLRAEAERIPPGSRVLMVADGEGRNSVYLAGLGHEVTAMDGAPNAVAKARKLAAARGVTVEFHVADIGTWDWTPEAYDAVAAIFIQFVGPEARRAVFEGIRRTLRPGGILLLHGYTPKQLDYGTGGPKAVENLYTEDQLRAELPGFEIDRLEAYEAHVDEGEGHSGQSALIDFVARKAG
ncbi:SAM-dependent methyltransferase [Acidimangrovimonas sediminis]|uniref:SAM-dependent methyltransferase n=1 Tax=Acidimangrovimonas sediminis TaxID=2056283 RepID=UPI000C8007F4|nr:class I SAM-dependent methyltransferase [Acidimangrovimonas sediminis]